ncbi:MAG: DUF1848 domain-containing protein [Mobilitalea sp.]
MILSVSRRTDIPNYYSEWFLNRIQEGFLYVRNPMNYHQISRIDLSPEVVDCIVFWTKNPLPMMNRLDELKNYKYYFQFTLTSYGRDMEKNIPNKRKDMIEAFQKLSIKIGKERVIWRYDPIIITNTYSMEYHIKAFKEMAESLCGYTDRVVISFVDMYNKIKHNMNTLNIVSFDNEMKREIASAIAELAHANHMSIETCAENIDLTDLSIEQGHCIDKKLIEKIIGYPIKADKDKGQRIECGCMESTEIGTYNTCFNGCQYCYANFNEKKVLKNKELYDPSSPLLCGILSSEDRITERKDKSIIINNEQLKLWD